MLTMEEVYYAYPDGPCVLKGVSLHIPDGKKCALIGHNGCGKTTLFLHTNGLLRPNSGRIYWNGEKMDYRRQTLQKWRREVGIVFQNPEHQLVAPLVRDELAFGLYHAGMAKSEMEELMEKALDEFGLRPWLDKPVHHLSLGQKKWLTLAAVMVMNPKLLVLDEPTAYLDRRQIRRFVEKINDIYHNGTTVLLATHDVDFVLEWADIVFVMHDGQIVMQGAPQDIFARQHPLQEWHLDVPLLASVWKTLFPHETRIPRNVEEMKQWMRMDERINLRISEKVI
ncbi:energy-coupling factor ABC transporter ATP-binding protein [Parageobacillus thermoglucosidasius]|uniref:energy-coupling factor ABC transporter ATP-binding protein n=1 Tax=Parageobacillus thermoglucosidasius TaxID=1426 RepID=UPI000F61C53B|nr:ABC transporter ATP-binding protein [Parageobacillus thermoglucosidasius]GCD84776.1 energy-coupling factor ABC transporter ATP-binding protein [Parageobacillus thermoglucosidasius]